MTMLKIKRDSLKKYQGEKLANIILQLIIGVGLNDDRRTWITKLNDGQRALFLLSAFDGEIRNGGLHQFFSNSSGDFTPATLSAVQLVKAEPVENLLGQAMLKFPEGYVSEDQDERCEALAGLPTNVFRDLDKAYYALLKSEKGAWNYGVRYLEAHEIEFFI